jgi:hypothetical protein
MREGATHRRVICAVGALLLTLLTCVAFVAADASIPSGGEPASSQCGGERAS